MRKTRLIKVYWLTSKTRSWVLNPDQQSLETRMRPHSANRCRAGPCVIDYGSKALGGRNFWCLNILKKLELAVAAAWGWQEGLTESASLAATPPCNNPAGSGTPELLCMPSSLYWGRACLKECGHFGWTGTLSTNTCAELSARKDREGKC